MEKKKSKNEYFVCIFLVSEKQFAEFWKHIEKMFTQIFFEKC